MFYSLLKSISWSWILDLLSPPYCVGCKKFLDKRVPLCEDCENGLQRIVSVDIPITKSLRARVFAVSRYEGVIRSLILAKHKGQRGASRQLGQLVARLAHCPWKTLDYVVSVPLHWTRYAFRGFNQSEIIAQEIAREHGVTCSHGVVRLTRTTYQARLNREDRKNNIAGVFYIDAATATSYKDKHILLVDDLMTTSTTIQEVGRIIAQCNPASITVVVAARVI